MEDSEADIEDYFIFNNIASINTNFFSEMQNQGQWNDFMNIIILGGIRFAYSTYTKRYNYFCSDTDNSIFDKSL